MSFILVHLCLYFVLFGFFRTNDIGRLIRIYEYLPVIRDMRNNPAATPLSVRAVPIGLHAVDVGWSVRSQGRSEKRADIRDCAIFGPLGPNWFEYEPVSLQVKAHLPYTCNLFYLRTP